MLDRIGTRRTHPVAIFVLGLCLWVPAQARTESAPRSVVGANDPVPETGPAVVSPDPGKEPGQPRPAAVLHERVTVVGTPETLSEIPGSAQLVSGELLARRQQGFDDVQRMLRPVPGLNIQEEEGFGRRPNIGMRGSGTDRSSKITLMEDGVPIAPAPYSAPAAYYFPVAGRMEALELRKGSSQIKYGPNTVGGALNLVSTSIPDALRLRLRAEGGQHGSGLLHAFAGDAYEHAAWLLETYQARSSGFKRLDGGGDTGFVLGDYVGKLRFHTSPGASVYQQLELKLGATEEDSDETYLGLTDHDFRVDPVRRYAASQLDRLDASHRQYQARHFVAFSPSFDVTTVGWRNEFERRWYKLEGVLGESLSAVLADPSALASEYAVLTGGNSEDGALVIRNNNRSYYSQGFQSVVGLTLGGGEARHHLEAGLRYIEDEEDRFQQDDGYRMQAGRMSLTRPGAPGSQSNRVSSASAWAIFVQDRVAWGRLSLVPGFRYEAIDTARTDYARSDPDRTRPTLRTKALAVFVPGVGASLRLRRDLSVFAGVHKGFAPPGPGASAETRPEESVNYELGLRTGASGFRGELTLFFNDYVNMLGRDTLAAGGSGSGDLFNAGKVRVSGLEAALSDDLGRRAGISLSLPVRASYTLTRAEFRNSFASQYEPWGDVQAGDELPYLPRHQLFVSVGAGTTRWLVDLSASYVARMRTHAGRGTLVGAHATDAGVALDVTGEYAVRPRLRLFASVQNLTDRRQIVSRHPAGARPGLPRTMMAGIKLALAN